MNERHGAEPRRIGRLIAPRPGFRGLSLVTRGALCALVVIFGLGATPALAGRWNLPAGSFGSAGTGHGQFNEPTGAAVNEATGYVYVVDRGDNRVEWFSATGSYEGQFNGSGIFEVKGKVETGAAPPTGELSAPEAIAIDNNPKSPSFGDVYVTDYGHSVVDKFSVRGEYLGQVTKGVAGVLNGLEGVAVDPVGHLWVEQKSKEIDEYSNTVDNALISSRSGATFGFAEPGFAVASSGALYVVSRFIHEVWKLTEAGAVEIKGGSYAKASATDPLAVDAAGDLLVDNTNSVGFFNPSGSLQESFGTGITSGGGIGVNNTSSGQFPGGVVYVVDVAANTVDMFVPEPMPPSVNAWVQKVTTDDATLEADITPNGKDTMYEIQYGSADCKQSPASCVDIAGTALGFRYTASRVRTQLTRLQAGTTYYFRVVATNELGESEASGVLVTQKLALPLQLLDGRQWELVSPPDKHGARIFPVPYEGVAQASANGDAITYVASGPIVGKPEGNVYEGSQILSTHALGGWSTSDIATPHATNIEPHTGIGLEYHFFSSDLSRALVEPIGETQLAAGVAEPTPYVRNNETGVYEPLVTSGNVVAGTKYAAPPGIGFLGASPDLKTVLLYSHEALVEGAGLSHMYKWNDGHLEVVDILPNGTLAPNFGGLGYESLDVRNAVSANGERIIWEQNRSCPELYLRDTSLQETVRLDEAHEGLSEPTCPDATYETAGSDGSHVLFLDGNRLLTDATGTGVAARDLYEFHVEGSARPLHGTLTDLTLPVNAAEAADVRGVVLGASEEEASFVYVVAGGVLTRQKSSRGQLPDAGGDNLYLLRRKADGTWEPPVFVAALSSEDYPDWEEGGGGGIARYADLGLVTSRVSPSGRYVVFMSNAPLTGYDSIDRIRLGRDEEVYRYDAETNKLSCVSCNPTGARPIGIVDGGVIDENRLLIDQDEAWRGHWLAASVPGWTRTELIRGLYQPRYLLDNGRVFFDSADQLVPQDSNGREDVYEYESAGVGGCATTSDTYSERNEGCVALISSGMSTEESAFLDASEYGNDVFFLTAAKLVGRDSDGAYDIYDAHVCSSETPCSSEGAALPICMSSESCREKLSQQPSVLSAPSSATFVGQGNLALQKPTHKKVSRVEQKLKRRLEQCRIRYRRNRHRRKLCFERARRRWLVHTATSRVKPRDTRGYRVDDRGIGSYYATKDRRKTR